MSIRGKPCVNYIYIYKKEKQKQSKNPSVCLSSTGRRHTTPEGSHSSHLAVWRWPRMCLLTNHGRALRPSSRPGTGPGPRMPENKHME